MKKTLLHVFILFLFAAGKTTAQQTVGLFLNDSLSLNGYTLFSNNAITYLVDNCGFVVNTWESDFSTNTSVYLLENGNLLRSCRVPADGFNGGGIAGRIELFNWEGDLLWGHNYATEQYHHHHDIEPLPNGNFLVLAWEKRTETESIESGRNPVTVSGDGIWPEQIVEIEMVGTDEINIVWEWHLWDHLVQDFDASKDNFGNIANSPQLLDINAGTMSNPGPPGLADWVHANGIAYNADLDQIAMSSRHLSEIYVIDHSTTSAQAAGHTGGNSGKGGDILYRYGNPENYERGDESNQKLYGQHNVTWLPEGHPHAGKMMAFNNGQNRFPSGADFSSVDIWEPPMDNDGNYIIESGEPYGPEDLTWTYEETGFYSANISGAHGLSNGHVMICEGRDGRFIEVTEDGEIVWEYIAPVTGLGPVEQGEMPNIAVFRAVRYPADYQAFEGRDLTPGDPIELNPLPSDCVIFGNPTVPVKEVVLEGVWLRQNPVSDYVRVKNQTGERLDLELWSATGQRIKEVTSADESIELAASDWPAGFYFLRIFNAEHSKVFLQKIIKN